jgi:hypothetical protein
MSAMLALYSVERVVAPTRFALVLIRSSLLLIAIACSGCATVNQLAAASPADQAQKIDPMLSAAGFKQLPASTPQQMERLKSLPPLKLGYYVDDNGGAKYWLADPDNCRCLFHGDEMAYQQYENMKLESQMADQQQRAYGTQTQRQQQMMMGPPFGPPGFGQSGFGQSGFSIGGGGFGISF